MTKEQFQKWLKHRFNTYIERHNLKPGYVEDEPWQVGGDVWREMEEHGILTDHGIKVVMDFEDEVFLFICTDGVLMSHFNRGAEGEIEWAAEPFHGNELEEATPEYLRLLARRLNRNLDGILEAIGAATKSLVEHISD